MRKLQPGMSYQQAKQHFDRQRTTLERETTRKQNPAFDRMIKESNKWNRDLVRSKSPPRRTLTLTRLSDNASSHNINLSTKSLKAPRFRQSRLRCSRSRSLSSEMSYKSQRIRPEMDVNFKDQEEIDIFNEARWGYKS